MKEQYGRLNDLQRFYALLDRLEHRIGGARTLSQSGGRSVWPQRGVYFFQEPGEQRQDTGKGKGKDYRIVRVGTHALKVGSGTKIWTRLSQHKGVTKTGGGNHRGSIFRLIVGASMIERDKLSYPTWGKGSSAPREIRKGELTLEQAVSKKIGDMPLLWLSIDDEPGPTSARGYIERNSIALLSNCCNKRLDPPSTDWLGRYCDRKLVRTSGLWNSKHVNEAYDSNFLDVLDAFINNAGTPE